MEPLLALLIGVLVAAGVFLMLQRNLLRVAFGVIILSNAVNLLMLTAGRITRGSPPLIPEGLQAPAVEVANPLPQALVLTAIVIGFGLVVFLLVLLLRGYIELGTVHIGELAEGDEEAGHVGGVERPGALAGVRGISRVAGGPIREPVDGARGPGARVGEPTGEPAGEPADAAPGAGGPP